MDENYISGEKTHLNYDNYGALFAKCTNFLHYVSDFVNTLYFDPLGHSRMLDGQKKVSESLDV